MAAATMSSPNTSPQRSGVGSRSFGVLSSLDMRHDRHAELPCLRCAGRAAGADVSLILGCSAEKTNTVLAAAEVDTALPQVVRQYVSAGGAGRAGLGERIPLTTSLASQYA